MQKSNKLKIEDIPRVKKHAISNELTTLALIQSSLYIIKNITIVIVIKDF